VQLDKDDLPYFVPYVLLDEATRAPSGKRQTRPMIGFWMSRSDKIGMRASDGRLRRSVSIIVLREIGGMAIYKAAAEVATILGRRTTASVSTIRADYYQRRHRHVIPELFWSQFLSWRAWVFESSAEQLAFILRTYGWEFGQVRLRRLSELIVYIILIGAREIAALKPNQGRIATRTSRNPGLDDEFEFGENLARGLTPLCQSS